MGADRAIRVDTAKELDCLQVAKCLAEVVRREIPNLVLSGKLAIDDESTRAPSMRAALLAWPQANQAASNDRNKLPRTPRFALPTRLATNP